MGKAVMEGWLMAANLDCAKSRSALGLIELAETSRLRCALRSAHPIAGAGAPPTAGLAVPEGAAAATAVPG